MTVAPNLIGRDPAIPEDDAITQRADELFHQHQQQIYATTDRSLVWLMFFQWIAGIAAAVWIAPFTWIGTTSSVHPHVWSAVILGGLLTTFPALLAWKCPGQTITRHTIAVAQMLYSGLLIHLTGGRIETHFHVFGSLAFLAFYRDWRVLIPATVVVALDHFVRGIYWPYSVYGLFEASPWRSLEHASWVIFEDVVLIASCLRSVGEMRLIATRQAQLEASHHIVEEKVLLRTGELKTSEERFRTIFEEGPLGMAQLDMEHGFVKTNRRLCDLLGLSEKQLLALKLADIITPEERYSDSALDAELVQGRSLFYTVEKRCLRQGEATFEARLTISIIRGNLGEAQCFLLMLEDVTEEKESAAREQAKERAERANLAKSEFLSRMSHELRTPLNAVLGFAELLEMDDLSGDQRDGVRHILKGGRHLLDLINEVLDISRIEAGHMHLSPEPVRVNEVLVESLDLIQPLASQRKIKVSHAVPSSNNWHVVADRQRLKQVLLNLLSNAIKYNSEAGAVTVTCLATDGRLRFNVTDTGAGIAAHKLEQLFTPFERLGAENSPIEGTGLGLALSKRLSELMGGSMGVQSTPGQGSTFWIELPLVADPLAGAKDELQAIPMSPGGLAQRTILYVEDNLSNLHLVERILKRRPDLKLFAAMQAGLGHDLARQHQPDLILLDLNLPDMSGHEALVRLQSDHRTCRTPVVIISADATPGQIDRLLGAGARAYLTKPLDIRKFLQTIDAVLASPSEGSGIRALAAAPAR